MAQENQVQNSIVRQSSLKMVLDYSRSLGVILTLKEIVKITNVIVDYCQNGYSNDIGKVLDAIDEHIKSKFIED